MSSRKRQKRTSPNILITGTPGTGKSHLCKQISEKLNMTWLDCSKLAKEHNFLEEYDSQLECPSLDEEKLLDYMEPIMQKGNNIVEYHSSEFFPERWFDVVYVTTTDNELLYDRLKERGYNDLKINSNITCEIFKTLLEEAYNSYKKDIVFELSSNTEEDAKANIKTIVDWHTTWKDQKDI